VIPVAQSWRSAAWGWNSLSWSKATPQASLNPPYTKKTPPFASWERVIVCPIWKGSSGAAPLPALARRVVGAAGALMATAAFYPIGSYPTLLIGTCATRLSVSFAERLPIVLQTGWSRSTKASTLLQVW